MLDLELDAFRRRVNAYAKTQDERRRRGEDVDVPSSMMLASNLLYLTPEQRAELNERIFDLLRDYELPEPDKVPEGAERMATMWSMIPDDRGKAAPPPKPRAARIRGHHIKTVRSRRPDPKGPWRLIRRGLA
ncbi:hypothetical protein ACOM2C_09675 [Pseudarthrobacter sp. So.54]